MNKHQTFEHQFPSIKWREPLIVRRTDRGPARFACRFCIAQNGLKGSELEQRSFATAAECQTHIDNEHSR